MYLFHNLEHWAVTLGSSQVSFKFAPAGRSHQIPRAPQDKGHENDRGLYTERHHTPQSRLGWDPVRDGAQGSPQPTGPGEEVRSCNPPSPGRTGTADLVIHKEEFTSPHVLLWENCSTGPPDCLKSPFQNARLRPSSQPDAQVCSPPRERSFQPLSPPTRSLHSPSHHLQCLRLHFPTTGGKQTGTDCSQVSRNPLRSEVKVTQDVYRNN